VPLPVGGRHKGKELMNMRSRSGKQALLWSLVAAAGFAAPAVQAAPIPFFDGFENVSGATYNGSGVVSFNSTVGWQVLAPSNGNVDIFQNTPGVHCHTGTGCIDLDGSNADTHPTGSLVVSDSFSLLAGHTYQLSAWISGNQRGAYSSASDSVNFTFLVPNSETPAPGTTIANTGALAPDTDFALFSVLYTPASNISVSVGFLNLSGDGTSDASDSFGAILDDVRVTDVTAVPLPASAWLLITGLLALGVFSRRNLPALTRA
jgi:hypothetical protein